jgi:RNA polymerase sigma factor (sigma-70 family)
MKCHWPVSFQGTDETFRREPMTVAMNLHDEAPLDRTTFDEMLVDMLPQLRMIARRLAAESTEASDLVQETCRRAIEARHQFRRGTNALAWLSRILRNIFYDNRRHDRPEISIETLALEAHPAEPIALWRRVSDEEYWAAVRSLPPSAQTTYRRCAIDGQPHQQMARALGVSPATVGVRLLRARTKIRAFLTQRLNAPSADDREAKPAALRRRPAMR